MKRIITIIFVLGLVLPAAAVASRVATGRTRTAIERAAAPQLRGIPERCLVARVTTKDGDNWATVAFNAMNYRSCERRVFNGSVIVHRARRTWHYVTSGSARIPCGRSGIPIAVRQDLHLSCG